MEVPVSYINGAIGVDLPADQVCTYALVHSAEAGGRAGGARLPVLQGWQWLSSQLPSHACRRAIAPPQLHACTSPACRLPQIAQLLSKMQLTAEPAGGGAAVSVRVPITRSDVLHGQSRAGVEWGGWGA